MEHLIDRAVPLNPSQDVFRWRWSFTGSIRSSWTVGLNLPHFLFIYLTPQSPGPRLPPDPCFPLLQQKEPNFIGWGHCRHIFVSRSVCIEKILRRVALFLVSNDLQSSISCLCSKSNVNKELNTVRFQRQQFYCEGTRSSFTIKHSFLHKHTVYRNTGTLCSCSIPFVAQQPGPKRGSRVRLRPPMSQTGNKQVEGWWQWPVPVGTGSPHSGGLAARQNRAASCWKATFCLKASDWLTWK